MNFSKLLTNIITHTYDKISRKLDHLIKLRILIYNLYDKIRLIEYTIKSKLFKENNTSDKIIFVNPQRIIYEKDLTENKWRLVYKFIKPLLNLGLTDQIEIISGDWDKEESLKIFNDQIKYRSFYQHFIEGINWKDTEYYKREEERYLVGTLRKEYNSTEDLDKKYLYLDYLYQKIKKEGFRTQKDIIDSEGSVMKYGYKQNLRKEDDDITIAIGKNKQIIFLDGRHRLIIAKLLQFKKIPVRVLIIHSDLLSVLRKK